MTTDQLIAGTAMDISRKSWLPEFKILIIAGCLLFNFFLCFANTAGIHISEMNVILFEITFVFLAASYGFFRPDGNRYFWLLILIAQFVLLAALSVIRDELLIKAFRDVIIMPVFIALGLVSAKKNFTKSLLWLSAFIAAIALFEAFSLDAFTRLFNIKEYYIAKGYAEGSFAYMGNENIFVSGIRPGGRFFPFPFEIHRISSVFLEPVSLGFYAFISGLYFIAMKDRLSRGQMVLALFLTFLLIWLGDARMAFGSLLMVMAFRPVFTRLDHRLSVLIFPAALLFGLFVVESGLFDMRGEGLGARILWTFNGLWSTEDSNFLGVRSYKIDMVDSGFLYLLGWQGIWGFLLYWLPPIFFRNKFSKEARIYWFGASIFLTSGLMISGAIFTIKTAALLWFCYGYIIARTGQPDGKTAFAEESRT